VEKQLHARHLIYVVRKCNWINPNSVGVRTMLFCGMETSTVQTQGIWSRCKNR